MKTNAAYNKIFVRCWNCIKIYILPLGEQKSCAQKKVYLGQPSSKQTENKRIWHLLTPWIVLCLLFDFPLQENKKLCYISYTT